VSSTAPLSVPDRSRGLYEAKARALVREHFGVSVADTASMPGGAALYSSVGQGTVWIYVTDAARSLGRAMALAVSRGCATLHLFVDIGGGTTARRAALVRPAPSVWRVVERSLIPETPTPRADAAPPTDADALVAMLRDAGLEVVVEHGVISGEIRGLSVATVVAGADGHSRLAVGVGRIDQEATDLLHGDLPLHETLANAIEEVRVHRHHYAKPHPVNRLARERWLRSQLIARPSIVGLNDIVSIAPAEPRANLRDPVPAAAIGHDGDGAMVLVVCSVGIDLELVPITADLIDREAPDRVVLAMPARDHAPIQHKLAAHLTVPVEFVAVEGEWPS